MAVQSGWSPQSFTGLHEPNQFNIIEHLIHNRLNQQCYSNIDNQFSREFLIKIHEQVGLAPFWSLLCSGGNTQQCCTIDRLSISGGQPESILTKFLHAGVEYVFAKLYSPEASHAQNPHEILKSNECPYSNRQGKVCINPVHFCRAFQTSTFNSRNQNTANLSDMILNRNESADVDLFQLNLMLEPNDSELPIGETISNDQSEFAFRDQLNSVSSSSGPVPQPILSPTSPHSTSFVTGSSHILKFPFG
ncbi:unnamed protein product [Oikopleura dioica]|uniref:MH1 domain-containing protein n=1 Tax=Oikopleura dioica TaxID=34765 RepID=E4XWJ5_OIKDI|nr:unnamed protein product [Oikopleura dioica]